MANHISVLMIRYCIIKMGYCIYIYLHTEHLYCMQNYFTIRHEKNTTHIISFHALYMNILQTIQLLHHYIWKDCHEERKLRKCAQMDPFPSWLVIPSYSHKHSAHVTVEEKLRTFVWRLLKWLWRWTFKQPFHGYPSDLLGMSKLCLLM